MSKRLDPRYLPLRGLLTTVWGFKVEVNKKIRPNGRMFPLVVTLPKITNKRVLIRAWTDDCKADGYLEKVLLDGDYVIEASFGFLLSAHAEMLVVRRFRWFTIELSLRAAKVLRRKDGQL